MIDFDTPSRRMVAEHAAGLSYRAIGAKHNVSHEHARQVVMRASRELADQVWLDLMVAQKYERMGRDDEAAWPTLLIRHGQDWSTALSLLQHLVDQLRSRSIDVHVRHRPLPVGAAFQLTLGGAAS